MCYIWCGIFPMDFTTTIDIVPQSDAFLLQSVVFPMNYPKTNCSIVLQNIIVYHKNSILLKCDLLAVKTGSLHLDSNQGPSDCRSECTTTEPQSVTSFDLLCSFLM